MNTRKKADSLKKSLAVLVILMAVALPWACTTNNSSTPTSPIITGTTTTTGTTTPTGSTATFTPTLVSGATVTATPTYIATPVYDATGVLSFQPNSFYSVPGSPNIVIGEGEVTAGGIGSMVEYYSTGNGDAAPNGNEGWVGYPTPGEAAVSYEGHSTGFVLSNPQGLAHVNGIWATLDSPGVIGAGDSPTLYMGDGDITGSPGLFQLPMENKISSYGGSPMKRPQSLVCDSVGRFYVADSGEKRVDEFLPDISNPNVPEYEAHFWTGSDNYTFKNPVALACDLSNDVYVGDTASTTTGPSVVQEYSSGGATVIGTWTLIPNCFINGLAVDGNSNFYISDIGNGVGGAGQVEEYHINSPSSATLVRAWTVPASAYEASLFFPGPIALIGNGTLTTINNILVGDQNTDTVRNFGP